MMREKLRDALRRAGLRPGVDVKKIGGGYYLASVNRGGKVRRGLATDPDEAMRRAES
jgi:hypothetical protein